VAKLATPHTDRLRPATVNHYLDALATLFNYAEGEGWITQNPARRLAIKGVKKRHRPDPSSIAELTAIFRAPLYVGCQDDESGSAKPGSSRPRRGRFWIRWWGSIPACDSARSLSFALRTCGSFRRVVHLHRGGRGDVDQTDRKRVKTDGLGRSRAFSR
jgi:hypothetical protein